MVRKKDAHQFSRINVFEQEDYPRPRRIGNELLRTIIYTKVRVIFALLLFQILKEITVAASMM